MLEIMTLYRTVSKKPQCKNGHTLKTKYYIKFVYGNPPEQNKIISVECQECHEVVELQCYRTNVNTQVRRKRWFPA